MSTSDAAGSPLPVEADENVYMTIPRRVQSCVMCQQRKVKCNREFPCSHCIRLGSECIKSVPAPPRRTKRRVTSQSELTAKIRHYEGLLKGQGMTIKSGGDRENLRKDGTIDFDTNGDDAEDADEMEVEATPVTIGNGRRNESSKRRKSNSPTSLRSGRGLLLANQGQSTYLDNTLWTSLTDELRDPNYLIQGPQEEEKQDSSIPINRYSQGGALLFNLSLPIPSLTKFHPPPVHIFKLWQAYLDNVNPLSKIVHTPTVQRHILDAAGNLDSISKPVEALMFAVYAAAVNSMEERDCEKTLGEIKSTLFSRYLIAAQEALIRASVLKTHNIVVLQAFTIFLLSIREVFDPNTLWVLTGSAVRICQRLGVHRDGAKVGLSIFETEMRRRLCWQLALLDSRSAQLLSNAAESLAEKDRKLEELEQLLEQKYLRHCDPLVPLHALSIAVARSAICKVRLLCHHPRQYADNGASMPQSEKDFLAINSLEIIEQDSSGQSIASLKRFSWHINCYFQFDAFVFLVHDLCQRTQGEIAERAWQQIQNVYLNQPILSTDTDNSLYCAIGNLTLKAWTAKEANCLRRNSRAPLTPYFILLLREQRRPKSHENQSVELQVDDCGPIRQQNEPHHIPDIHRLASYEPNFPRSDIRNQHHQNNPFNPAEASPSASAYDENLGTDSNNPNNNANYQRSQSQSQSQNLASVRGQLRKDRQGQGHEHNLLDPNNGFDNDAEGDGLLRVEEDFQRDEAALDWSYWHELMKTNDRQISEEGWEKIFD